MLQVIIMKILVCIKQVADTEARFSIGDDNRSIRYADDTVYRMNRFDEFALEEALQIREKHTGTVDAISVGPPRIRSTIRRAIELGADKGIRLAQDETTCSSPRIVAGLVASFAAGEAYDLILTGAMSEDDMYGQTGQMIAGLMNIPSASAIIMEKINESNNTVYAEREIDAATRDAVTLRLPALLTIQSGINNPRYPSLSNVLRARKQEIEIINPDKVSADYEYETVAKIRSTAPSRKCIFLTGTAVQKAIVLKEMLHEKALW
jgi:electron transfer flavoprotein beta subunit